MVKSEDGTRQAHGVELHIEYKRERYFSIRTSQSELELSALLVHNLLCKDLFVIDLLRA